MADFKTLRADMGRTFLVVLAAGDNVTGELRTFARAQDLQAASLTAIGGFSRSTLAYFDVDARRYDDIPVDDQAEVLSLVGSIVRGDGGDWQLHAHAVLGLRDGSTRGGHLRDAIVRPTLKVMVTESPAELTRRYDENSGLALIDVRDTSPVEEVDPLRHGLAP